MAQNRRSWSDNRQNVQELERELPGVNVALMQEARIAKCRHGRDRQHNFEQAEWLDTTTGIVYSVGGSDGLLVSSFQPTQARSAQEFDAALDELEALSLQARRKDWVCICGDFNSFGGAWLCDGEAFGENWWQERELTARACAVRAWAQGGTFEEITTRASRRNPQTTR